MTRYKNCDSADFIDTKSKCFDITSYIYMPKCKVIYCEKGKIWHLKWVSNMVVENIFYVPRKTSVEQCCLTNLKSSLQSAEI